MVIFGGRSEIGLEVAVRLAPGNTVVLAARRAGDLSDEQRRVLAAGAIGVDCVEFDAGRLDSHESVLAAIIERHGAIDVAVLAFGLLGDQARAETDAEHAAAIVHIDYVAQIALLTSLAVRMRGAGRGALVVFSSIAGWRVRRANYVYGSAKAGLDGFASGLADALHGSGVHVLLARPGFVIGRMSAGMSPAPLSSTPPQVAEATVRALRSGKRTVWIPRALGALAFVMRWVPSSVWRKMPR
ncbi:SDR family NAD(P)-dependent oxidoreductase [Mycobacteroides franklinii]|uniref:SDR family NAD(P)-dependent oxidoreductase n=1 Tax=Mycobacteroides franklinii TaxID=948102 RepID=UPI0009945A62|nr:SDR family NAD(P)-dependent oxidoreductase [Mycobacteroides franklinii]